MITKAMSNTHDTVQWFRAAAPYIRAHRERTFVILVADDLILSEAFLGLTHDIALLHHLGIKLVLLHGSRRSIDAHLARHGIEARFHHHVRVTDAEALPHVVEAINEVRTRFESHLSMGLPNTPMSGAEISLISGNFVTGMPLGVIDGVDMQHSGKVRSIRHGAIRELLANNHVVLLSNLGYSRTGEVFNLPAEELAGEVARALAADKLIYAVADLGDGGALGSTLSTRDCESLIEAPELPDEVKNLLRQAVYAIQGGVRRVHLLDQRVDGGLLLELFTRDGYGSMVTNLFYQGTRDATIDDIGGILRLIEPLEANGTLLPRSREQIELEIGHFQVIDKDGMIVGCVACIPHRGAGIAEIACLAVHDDYRNAGLGSDLLERAENRAADAGLRRLYTLTTRTSHWFLEHGFAEDADFELPAARRESYNPGRGSKLLAKSIQCPTT